MESILFHAVDVTYTLKHKTLIRKWLTRVAGTEKHRIGTLNFILCSDEYLLEINRQFLQHDYYTDVITFDYSESKTISGDIYISLDRVKENASINRVKLLEELLRIMVHGSLHLLGYQDKTMNNKAKMTRKEDQYLSLILKEIVH